jgi:hypothetical protein
LLEDWIDKFDDTFRTRDWWEGGANAPGEAKTNSKDRQHPDFIEMAYKPGASWRLFRNSPTFYVFGSGLDKVRFFDSSDIYLKLDVRLPGAGTAWIAARTTISVGGATIDGFRLELTRLPDNTYRIVARGQGTNYRQVFFDDVLPAQADGTTPDWITVLILTYHDQVAFFANGRFLTAANNVPILSGTVAFGVEEGTTAQFDTFELRDVSPETR